MATTEQWKDDLASCISNILNSLAALTARIEALEAQAAQPAHKPAMTAQPGEHPDTRRLRWLMENGAVEGFSHVVQDRYELAAERATAEGRDEPNADDEFSGFRLLIDLAMTTDAASVQPAQAEQEPERGKALWQLMNRAWASENVSMYEDWARVLDAVADWLAAKHPANAAAANALRAEARCTLEGRRG